MASKAKQTPGTHLAVVKGARPPKVPTWEDSPSGRFEAQLTAVLLGEPTGKLSKHLQAIQTALENDEHGAFASLSPRVWDRLFGKPRETVQHEGGTTLRVVYVDE